MLMPAYVRLASALLSKTPASTGPHRGRGRRGEDSWLVALLLLLLLRVADQATSGQRHALFFTHFNVFCFLALTGELHREGELLRR